MPRHADRPSEPNSLLTRCIVALPAQCPGWGQTACLIQYHRDSAILYVSGQVLRDLNYNKRYSQLDADFRRGVRKTTELLHREMAPSNRLSQLAEQPRSSKFFGVRPREPTGSKVPMACICSSARRNRLRSFASVKRLELLPPQKMMSSAPRVFPFRNSCGVT